MNIATVDAQADQFIGLVHRFDLLPGHQAVFGQLCEAFDQARHIDHQFSQSIDLAFEFRVLQRRRQLLAFDLIHAATYCLAGEKAGQVAGDSARRPQVVSLGQQAHARQVQLALAVERFTPAARHVGDGFGGTGQRAVQCVLGAAVNDPLRLEALPATQAGAFYQHCREPLTTQPGIEPETGDASPDNQHVSGNNRWHEHLSEQKVRAL